MPGDSAGPTSTESDTGVSLEYHAGSILAGSGQPRDEPSRRIQRIFALDRVLSLRQKRSGAGASTIIAELFMTKPKKPTGVQPLTSALKTFALLDIIMQQDRPFRLADLTHLSGESRGTVYQRLITLVEAGWVEQCEPGLYRASLRVAYAGEAALEQASLGERASSVLQELVLELGETASLAVFSGIHARLVKRVEAEVVVRAQVRVGTQLSLSESSSGRVLTAFSSPEYLHLLKAKGAQLAPDSLLEEVRQQGYAISSGKDVPGVRSIAMPIFSRSKSCIAALSVVAPEPRFNSKRFLPPLTAAVKKLNTLVTGPQSAL